MSTTITTPAQNTNLVTLATLINEAHDATLTAARTTLEHARRAGELLNEAKSMLGHGKWLPWLAASVSFSPPTAQRYMRVASRWGELANASSVTHLTEATALLAAPPENDEDHSQPNNWRPFHELPKENRADLCKKWWDIRASRTVLYHAAGWNVAKIAETVQNPEQEVHSILNPRIDVRFGEPGARFFTDQRGEDTYQRVAESHVHNCLWTVFVKAASVAALDGFPELTDSLDAIAEYHRRRARSLPSWIFLKDVDRKLELAVNSLAITDSRRALGVWQEQARLLGMRVAEITSVLDDFDNNIDAEIDWAALERCAYIARICREKDWNPATMLPWNEKDSDAA